MRPFFIFLRDPADYGRVQREPGAVAFTADALAVLATLWTPARYEGQDFEAATFRLPGGQGFRVLDDAIEAPAAPDHLWHQAAMRHIATRWGGRCFLALDPEGDPEPRLWARAYAEVCGVELADPNDLFVPYALLARQLARVTAMREEIRALHADAPPAKQRPPSPCRRRTPSRLRGPLL
jgi:hypothetical protein